MVNTNETTLARSGRRVLWIGDSQPECRAQLDADTTDTNDITRITRTAGREEIRYQSGGSIRYISRRSRGAQGATADILSVTPSAHSDANISHIVWYEPTSAALRSLSLAA